MDMLIRAAIVGCGAFATNTLLPCLTVTPGVKLVAACDKEKPKAQAAAEKFGASRHYVSYDDMLREEELDACLVVGPATLHLEAGTAVLRAGLHLFVEKPPAVRLRDAEQIAEVARAAKGFAQIGTMWRHAKANRMASSAFKSGELGKPLYYRCDYLCRSPRSLMYPEYDCSLLRFLLLDQGIHAVDCARFLMGDITQVDAVLKEFSSDKLLVQARLEFQSGALGLVTINNFHSAYDIWTAIACEDGKLALVYSNSSFEVIESSPWANVSQSPSERFRRSWETWGEYRGWVRHGYVEELSHFVNSIRSGRAPEPNLDDALAAMRVLEAMNLSIQRATPVALAEVVGSV